MWRIKMEPNSQSNLISKTNHENQTILHVITQGILRYDENGKITELFVKFQDITK